MWMPACWPRSARVFVMLTGAGLLLLAHPESAWAERRHALVVGANTGWAGETPLRHARADAERVARALVELGGFARADVTVLLDPTTGALRDRLRSMEAAAAKGPDEQTLLFFYYSGHADEQSLHLLGEPLGLDELQRALEQSAFTVRIGVFDACRSGAIAAKGARPAARFEVAVVDELEVRGLALLTSSGADELSQEQGAVQGSVFTHHLVSGLRGGADANGDGKVTLAESYGYAFDRTLADTSTTPLPQRPAFRYELEGQGGVVLSWLQKGGAWLLFPRGPPLRHVILDEHEANVIAEGRPSDHSPTRLALPPGRYRLKQLRDRQLQVASLSLGPGQEVSASSLDYSPSALSAGWIKGREDQASAARPRAGLWPLVATLVTGATWAVAGGRALHLRGRYATLERPLTPAESESLSAWSVTSDVAMGITAGLALTTVVTW